MAPGPARVTLSLTGPLLSAALFPGQGLSLSPSLLLLSSRAIDVGKSWAVQVHVCSIRILGYKQENRAHSLRFHVDMSCATLGFLKPLSNAFKCLHFLSTDVSCAVRVALSKVAELGSREEKLRVGDWVSRLFSQTPASQGPRSPPSHICVSSCGP